MATWMEGVRAATPQQLQIPPLRFAPVGMTRGEWLLTARMATWMEGIRCGYAAATADPSTTLLLRSARDDNSDMGVEYFSLKLLRA
jgi:hypothetical protein